jgi:CHASE2 domain-containing sensor protein
VSRDGSHPGIQAQVPAHKPGHLARELCLALLVVLVLTLGKLWFEHTPDGESLQYLTYDRQQRLDAQRRPRGEMLPVAVVDITALGPVPSPEEGRPELITPREPLLRLMRELANSGALGVGVDVDFSPDRGRYVTAADPRFFHQCRELTDDLGRPVPVFLGIRRTQSLPRAHWLGGEDAAALAAQIAAPREDRRKLPAEVQVKGQEPVCSLSARLAALHPDYTGGLCRPAGEAAGASGSHRPDGHAEAEGGHASGEGGHASGEGGHPRWPSWLAEQFEAHHGAADIHALEYLVDYSPVRQLMDERIKADRMGRLPTDLEPARLAGKLVLVGYATPGRSTDMTRVPGYEDEVPGVFAHAAGVYTLVDRPLYELRHLFRLVLDLVLAAVLVGIVFGVRLRLHRAGAEHATAHRVELFTILGLIVVVWVAGSQLPLRLGLIWTDYILVVLALLLHPYAGTMLEAIGERLSVFGRSLLPRRGA